MSAKFPGEAPTVYGEKSTANDVGDARHWDGADANQARAEIVAIAAKVGVDGDTTETSHDYKIRALEGRKQTSTGSGTLTAGTTTTVNDETIGATSCVMVQGTNAGFDGVSPRAYVSAVTEGSFTLTHGTATGTESFAWVAVK